MRLNGLPSSVPLTVTVIAVMNCASAPRLVRSTVNTVDTLPVAVWTSRAPACVTGPPGRLVTRSMPATSSLLGGGARKALNEKASAGTLVCAAPWPIWHACVYWGDPVTQDGLALALARTPGASVIVTVDGVPADVSRLVVVV